MSTDHKPISNAIIPSSGPYGYPWLGVIPAVWRNPLQFLVNTAQRYGDIATFQIGSRTAYLVNEPEWIGQILQRDKSEDTTGLFNRGMRSVFGSGLQTSRGRPWREQRLLLQPAFHPRRVKLLCDEVARITNEMLDRWTHRAANGTSFDVADEMRRLTCVLSLRTMLGRALVDHEVDVLTRAFAIINKQLFFHLLLGRFAHLPTLGNRRFQRSLAVINTLLKAIISTRKTQPVYEGDDPLSILLRANTPDRPLSETQLRDHLITLLFAAQETTANALAWTFYLVSQHPAVESCLLDELATVLNGAFPTADTLPQLTYTRCVVQESLRLYPPVYVLAPASGADDIILGRYRIPAGSQLIISQYVMHRHPRYWAHPERFEPERFSERGSTGRPRYAYFPFGGGPQVCLGSQLALMQMTVIVAQVIQAYHLKLTAEYPIVPQASLTLRPRQGVHMTVSHR